MKLDWDDAKIILVILILSTIGLTLTVSNTFHRLGFSDATPVSMNSVEFLGLSAGVPVYSADCGVDNAYYDGSQVILCNELMGTVTDPSQLQSILYHEIGHAMLGHTNQTPKDSEDSRRMEYDADMYSYVMMKGLGFGVEACGHFKNFPVFDDTNKTHPSSEKRYAICIQTIGGK